jgi:hypothetical protein
MFERYTEGARQAVFYARYETSLAGSPHIESEHMLLGLLRIDPKLRRRLPNPNLDAVRAELIPTPGPKSATSVDLPLSHSMKRALAYASEDAERLGHRHIGTDHLVLGLLREQESAAARFLQQHGLDRATLWREASENRDLADPAIPIDRESLHKLVDSLPEDALQPAGQALQHMQQWPPKPVQLPPRIAKIQEDLQRRTMEGRRPGFAGTGGGGGNWTTGPHGDVQDGRYTSTRKEDGATVVETHHFFRGQEITVTQRFQFAEDGKTLTLFEEAAHGQQRYRNTMEFEFS